MADNTIIKLNTGLKPFKIQFDDSEETTTIYFNPTDANLPKRMFEAKHMIEEKTKGIKDVELDENGIPKTDEYIDMVNEVNNAIYETIDYAFGNKISDVIFSKCSPLSIPNGEYFILQFLNTITLVIENIVKKESKKASANVEKHLGKYMKK